MPDKVRCRDCGFLAIRNKHTRELMEVEQRMRTDGEFPLEMQPHVFDKPSHIQAYIHEVVPLCFAMETGFCNETRGMHVPDVRGFAAVIEKERVCEKFIEWRQGWTPREHSEMNAIEEVRKREDRRDQTQLRYHAIEILAIVILGIFSIWTAFATTRMQIEDKAKDAVEAEAKIAVQRELDARLSPPKQNNK